MTLYSFVLQRDFAVYNVQTGEWSHIYGNLPSYFSLFLLTLPELRKDRRGSPVNLRESEPALHADLHTELSSSRVINI